MTIYADYVFPDKLISPVTGYQCRRLTSQNIKFFGFNSIDELLKSYPEFPLICENSLLSFTEKSNEGNKLKNERLSEKRKSSYLSNPIKCNICHKSLDYSKRNNKYCSRSCAAKHNNSYRSRETREKIRLTLKRLAEENKQNRKLSPKIQKKHSM